MIRTRRFLVVAGAVAVLGLGVHYVPQAFGGLEFFRVDRVEVEGLRYLDREEALMVGAVPHDLSVWDDLEPVATRLERHPLVRSARARRRLPSTLVLEVEESRPVALHPTPALTPVDRDGRTLPIDPVRHRLDLPLLHVAAEGPPALLAGEVVRLAELEPAMSAVLSEISLDPWGDVILHLGNPRIEIHYRPPLSPTRLREGIQILGDALERTPERVPLAVDLRFADQVVVRYSLP